MITIKTNVKHCRQQMQNPYGEIAPVRVNLTKAFIGQRKTIRRFLKYICNLLGIVFANVSKATLHQSILKPLYIITAENKFPVKIFILLSFRKRQNEDEYSSGNNFVLHD